MKLIRKIKARKLPSCAKCKHCSKEGVFGAFSCRVPEYLELIEKTKCYKLVSVDAFEVRGTKYCKFESKEQ